MKTILITGASRGIGRAIAIRFSAPDTTLYLTGRDAKGLGETGNQVKSKGGNPIAIVADLSSPEEVEKVISELSGQHLDLLVNNAGMAVVKPFQQLSQNDWDKTLAVNLTAPFLLTKMLSPEMPEGSSIVNILSIAAKTGFPNWSSYCASKFGMEGLTQSIREELRPRGIRVTNIYPGRVDTSIWKGVPGEWPQETMIKAEDVAGAVYYAYSQPPGVQIKEIELGKLRKD